jgi:hypothetical protein
MFKNFDVARVRGSTSFDATHQKAGTTTMKVNAANMARFMQIAASA